MSSEADVSDGFLENRSVWVELESHLDKHSILELSKRYSVPAGQIAAALKRTGRRRTVHGHGGVERLPPEPGEAKRGPSAVKAPAGTQPKKRRRRGAGSKAHILETHRAILGKVSDAEVARRTGVSTRTVAAFRAKHMIAGYDRWSDPSRERTQKRGSRIDPFRHLVGTMPDAEVAKRAGVSPQAVRNYRSKNDIPAPRRANARSKAAPAAPAKRPPASAIPASGYAWRVSFVNGEQRIAVAASMAALVAVASDTKHGEVVKVERLEPMI